MPTVSQTVIATEVASVDEETSEQNEHSKVTMTANKGDAQNKSERRMRFKSCGKAKNIQENEVDAILREQSQVKAWMLKAFQ